MRKVVVSLGLVAGLLGGGVGAVVPASASSRTVVYNTTNPGPWNHPASRPGKILGAGYAIWGMRRVSWSKWNVKSAYGHGRAFGNFVSELRHEI
jgi:hypothetical protein